MGANSILSASGGLSYTWSPAGSLSSSTGATVSASPTSLTIYTVTAVNSNGCMKTQTQSIDISLTSVNISSTSNTICGGQTTTLTASGGNSYTWSPSS